MEHMWSFLVVSITVSICARAPMLKGVLTMCKNSRSLPILFCLIWFCCLTTLAGAGSQWARTIGGTGVDTFTSTLRTGDGGYLFGGHTTSFGAGGRDAWLVKTDASGDIVWQRTYGGAGNDTLADMDVTEGEGIVFVGSTESFGAGGLDVWCVRLDADGNLVWQNTYGSKNEEWALCVERAPDGGFIVGGVLRDPSQRNAWCLKLDALGIVVWQKAFLASTLDGVRDMRATADGGVILVGNTDDALCDVWCIRLDSIGNVAWQQAYTGSGSDVVDAVDATDDGGYVFAGYTDSFGSGSVDAWLVRLDALGNVLWQRTYEGGNDDAFMAVRTTADGGSIVEGTTNSSGAGNWDVWCVKLGPSGDVIWQKTSGGVDIDGGTGVEVATDGGYVLAGYTLSFGAGNCDGLCLRIDSTGDIGPACPTLIGDSKASLTDAAAVASVYEVSETPTTVVGIPSGAVPVKSSATTLLLCSGDSDGPMITSITSRTSKPGSSATIRGAGFSTDKTKDVVYFGTKKVKTITRARPTSLVIVIPRVKKGTVDVYVTVNGQKSNTMPFQVK